MKTYIVRNKDNDVVSLSRSGGFFSALTDGVLAEGGIVYGCILDESLNVKHVRATSKETRDCMRKSKYVQSDITDSFDDIRSDLEQEKRVVFSGTPCQVKAIRNYLEIQNVSLDNILFVDIACHGVPSPGFWRDYIKYMEKKTHMPIVYFDFRNKLDYGWKKHVETMYFQNSKSDSIVFAEMFWKGYSIRECCYNCSFKTLDRDSDITIADAWGIEKKDSEYNDDLGTSLVLVHSAKGQSFFEDITELIRYEEVDIADYMQGPFEKNLSMPELYYTFWKQYEEHGFRYIARRYSEDSAKRRFKRFLKKIYTILR